MKKTLPNRIVALMMCLFLLMGPFSSLLLLPITAAEDATKSASGKVAITLTWTDGTTGVKSTDSNHKVHVRVKVSGGTEGEAVKITLGTINLSAVSGGEYGGFKKEITLYSKSGSDTYEHTISVHNQKKYDTDGNRTDDYYPAVKVGNTVYRRQFGVQIISHSENAYVKGERTLRAYVRIPNSDWEIYTNKNTGISFYDGSSKGFSQTLHDKGYSYKATSSVYVNRSPTFYSEDGSDQYNEDKDRYTLERNQKTNDEGYWLFQEPRKFMEGKHDPSLLISHTNGWYIYIAGTFKMTKAGGTQALHNNGMRYWIQQNDPTDKSDWDGKHPVDNNGQPNIESGNVGVDSFGDLWRWPRSANDKKYTIERNDFKNWLPVWGYQHHLKPYLHCDNDEGDVDCRKWISDVTMSHILLRNADQATTVEDIRISQNESWSGDNELYLMVRLSDPVQLYSSDGSLNDFTVTAQAYDGNKSVGGTIEFRYLDGNYTDTLIFQATMSDSNRGVLYGNRLRISDISYHDGLGESDTSYAADLFMNTLNCNNSLNFSINHLKTDGDLFIDCKMDARVPEIRLTSTIPTGPAKSHSATVQVSNMAEGGTLSYMWSGHRDINNVVGSWTKADLAFNGSVSTATLTGEGFNGDLYLHVIATSKSGLRTSATFKLGATQDKDQTFRFDNTPPKIEATSGNGQEHSRYKKSHKIVLKITDPQTSDPGALSKVKKVWYYAKDAAGNIVTAPEVQVYGGQSDTMTFDQKTHTFTMTVSSADVGLESGKYGSYSIYFIAEDESGNKTTYENAIKLPQPLMLDNRANYPVTTEYWYGDQGNLPEESKIDADFMLDGYDIVYNEWAGKNLLLRVVGADVGSADDKYELYTVMRDGELIYDRDKGGWMDGFENPSFFYHEDHFTVTAMSNHENKMLAAVAFTEKAYGRYDFVFIKNNAQQSEIVTLYVSPLDAETPNYAAFYDEERLLINKVWQFSTGNYYSSARTKSVPYDGADGAKPIFSSYEKAYEYARFKEAEDIQIIHLTGEEGRIIADLLNSKTVRGYQKADGETITAEEGQTWLRYKSEYWTPSDGNNADLWVYYFYSEQLLTAVGIESIDDLESVNPNLERALADNAADIAHSPENGGTWIYLTKNATNSYTDSYGQPTYERSAVFSRDLTMRGPFARDMTYKGDSAIYSSFIDCLVGTTNMELPVVANYTFEIDDYNIAYYRAEGATDWIPLSDGQTLRSFGVSGVYEIMEIGGGYRHYFIYCDLNAPMVVYRYTLPGQEPDSEQRLYFNKQINGLTFQAQELNLRYFVDSLHQLEGLPIELDPYSYLYLTQTGAGGMVENVAYFFTMDDLNRAEDGFEIPDGTYKVYVYDRLGNSYSFTVHTNRTPLMTVEPVVAANESVTFSFNRNKNQIETFSVTRIGSTTTEVDTDYAKTKVYVKSGTYELYIEDIFGNIVTRTVTLEREPPVVSFFYKSAGAWKQLTPIDADTAIPQASASVQKHDKDVYVISSSVDVRIGYSAYARYTFSISPDTTLMNVVETTNNRFIEVPVTDTRWTMTVCYANDADAKVTITCINDSTPPEVTAQATLPEYGYSERLGYGHVLPISEGGTTVQPVVSGDKAAAHEVIFSWTDGPDGSGVEVVTYTLNGGELQRIDPKLHSSFTAHAPGTYHFTVTDLLNNTTEFTFTISDNPDFDMTLADGTAVAYPDDPLDFIQGSGAQAIFTETAYTGQDFHLLLRETLTLTFLRRVGDDTPTIHRLGFRRETLTLETLGENGFESLRTIPLSGETQQGEITDFGSVITYSLEKDGLRLTFPSAELPLEQWQLRVTDPFESAPVVIQLERSNCLPALTPMKADSRQTVAASGTAFTGINEPFTFTGDAADIISIVAYRSPRYTTDFSSVSQKNTYDMLKAGLIGTVDEEGYFKIVITNKYGNRQTFLLRVSFGADLDVILTYEALEAREHILKDPGSYEFFTNGSAVLRVWNTEARLSVQKDGRAYNPTTRTGNGCIEVSFKEIGTYVVVSTDDFGNNFTLRLTLDTPRTLTYDRFLTDFNPDALMRDEHYTNAPVSLALEAMQHHEIAYAAYRMNDQDTPQVLYDMLSQTRVDYDKANFERSIGQKNGTYTVVFADKYGNLCETKVYISDKPMLSITRNTKNSAGNMDVSVQGAMSDGVWSNYIVRLYNEAAAYRLTIDGVTVSFNAENEYICELALSLGDNVEATHTVSYVDSYGNKYEFTIHLLRRIPAVTALTDGEEVVRGGTVYVKGRFGFTWEDPTIMAVYTLDSQKGVAYAAGELFDQDGTYSFTFTDIAGNIETRRICRDTVVSYALVHSSETVQSGIAVSGQIRINESGESITITEILRNGEPWDGTSRVFNQHGSYTVTLTDEVGNTATVTFDIFNDPMKAFTYVSKGEYAIYQVWYYIEGVKQPANGIMLNADGYQEFTFYDDGTYEVDLLHVPTNTYVTYTVEIDNLPPDVRLVGDITNGVTRDDLVLEGLSRGDTVEVWLNGKLTESVQIGSSPESPKLRRAGTYELIIRDIAGNETKYTFEREFTTNTAANVLICLVLMSGAVGCALFLHNRGRIRIK